MNYTVTAHLLYLAICLPVVIWTGRILVRHGQVFLTDVYRDERVAVATNRLLAVGFYLLNAGFTLFWLSAGREVEDFQGLIESLSIKVGIVIFVLGIVHMINVKAFASMRRRQVVDDQRISAYQTQLDAWAANQRDQAPAPR